MASDIQENAIPRVFPPFPEERSIDIWGDMKTAKEVGGDFYDFYFTGPRRVMFMVADVSGKGVPAALFMMRAKTAIKGAAQTGKDIAEVVVSANEQLCDGNGACMFVTAFICEIDLDTGTLRCVNAGHNPPIVRRKGKLEYLRIKTGMALGAMSGLPYVAKEIKLEPGDEIYLYTDGITEQPDRNNKMFGEDGLLAMLEDFGDRPLESLPKAVVDAVMAHAGTVEQADDCTQIVVRYNGKADR
jgi:sigma-B regulation protein RsbU (phosphoserine phosphatase)